MRGKEVNAGSIRALLIILALLFGNIVSHTGRSAAPSKDLVALTKSSARLTKIGNEIRSAEPRDPSTSLGMTEVARAFKK